MIEKGNGFVGYDEVTYTNDVITPERQDEWQRRLLEAYANVYGLLKEAIDNVSPIDFFLNQALLKEVSIDAAIGMNKLTSSDNNDIDDPNAFKEAAYLAYWWLRHKPASIHFPKDFDLDEVELANLNDIPEDKREFEQKKLVWRLKHINELVATEFVLTYIFDFEHEICKKKECKNVKKGNDDSFAFDNFEEMKNEAIDNLVYYFSYRALAPKVIEQMLEAYAFHPAWKLTGDLWNNGGSEG